MRPRCRVTRARFQVWPTSPTSVLVPARSGGILCPARDQEQEGRQTDQEEPPQQRQCGGVAGRSAPVSPLLVGAQDPSVSAPLSWPVDKPANQMSARIRSSPKVITAIQKLRSATPAATAQPAAITSQNSPAVSAIAILLGSPPPCSCARPVTLTRLRTQNTFLGCITPAPDRKTPDADRITPTFTPSRTLINPVLALPPRGPRSTGVRPAKQRLKFFGSGVRFSRFTRCSRLMVRARPAFRETTAGNSLACNDFRYFKSDETRAK
jgi:hypothetical protein